MYTGDIPVFSAPGSQSFYPNPFFWFPSCSGDTRTSTGGLGPPAAAFYAGAGSTGLPSVPPNGIGSCGDVGSATSVITATPGDMLGNSASSFFTPSASAYGAYGPTATDYSSFAHFAHPGVLARIPTSSANRQQRKNRTTTGQSVAGGNLFPRLLCLEFSRGYSFRRPRMCQLRSDVNSALAPGWNGTLFMQRLRSLSQDERTE